MVLGVAGVALIVVVNTVVAALLTRFFRVRLDTRLGSLIYALVLGPVVLVAILLVLSGPLGVGADLGQPGLVIFVTIAAPLGLGLTVDYVWMPPPEAVEPRAPR